ncbi:MAG: PIN domain-containing protein [Sulfolobaceae archaeon]|nr:PIN domain-containing protein [Sulfolobaceae archaeon]
MEERYLLDTDILVSKQFANISEPYVVSLVSVFELASVVRKKYLNLLAKNDKSRAEGYREFLNLVLSQIKDRIVQVFIEDLEEGIDIMFERDVNLGEAINAVIAKRLNCKVISNDKDWERLSDIAEVKRIQ